MNMGTPHPSRNQGKVLKYHGIERVNGIVYYPVSHYTQQGVFNDCFKHLGEKGAVWFRP